ncbi:aminopeptidase N [Actinoplanes sp. NPDC051633]|uniref:aminopeptidase N n=1 Tax=Actinoplanes sp. NPDC051633 TaxID=3155670 RepID=UPI0034322125
MDVKSLTQTEAQARAALLTVERYEIAVDLTDLPTGPRVRTVSTITFACGERDDLGSVETFVDCAATVLRATLNGAELGPASEGRLPLTGLARSNTLVVEAEQAETSDGPGLHRAVDPADGEVYMWTSFEPDEARHVWACFDQPDLKAPHVFTVTAPAGWTVLSNSGDASVSASGSSQIWAFPATPPLSTYNVVVNAGPLHEVRRPAGDHDLGLYARRSLAAVVDRDADNIFTVTEQGLAFYAEAFGMPFPQRRYDQVFMPEFGGAMENYGCVTWSDQFLRRSAPTPAEDELLAKVLLHEMAHMWFGNIVTMRWWDDLWLNEAFAEFACNWAAEGATIYTDAWASHLADDKLTAYIADQGPTSHPIHQPINDVAEAASIFDNITYPKGASVLRQLMVYVGEDNFRAGMTDYFARHAWGSTTLQDLIDALAATSGRDLDAWRSGWLSTAGVDRLTLEESVLVGRGPDGPPRPQVVAVGAYENKDGALVRTELRRVEVSSERTPVDLPAADFYLVNDDDLTFATTRPAAPALAAALPTPISRGVAVATVWDALLAGELSAAEVAECLTSVLRVETSDAVIEPYLMLACEVAEVWAPPAVRAELMASVASVCDQLAASRSRRRVALRFLARVTTDVAALQDAAGDDVDLGWRALIRKAELGGETAAESRALLARDTDPDAKFRALAVRAATPTVEAKEEVWQALTVDRSVPIGSFAAVTTAFHRPGQEELLAPYGERYLELLPDLHRPGMILAMFFARRLFPVHGVDEAYLSRAATAAEASAPVVRKTVDERADEVRRMIRTRDQG